MKTAWLRALEARAATSRPAGVMLASTLRPSRGLAHPLDEAVALQAVHRVRDAGRVDLEPLAHLADREGAACG